MFPGETILSGAPIECPDCGVSVSPEVLVSGAGFYIGTRCNCGPNTRESAYMSCAMAEKLLPAYEVAFVMRMAGLTYPLPPEART